MKRSTSEHQSDKQLRRKPVVGPSNLAGAMKYLTGRSSIITDEFSSSVDEPTTDDAIERQQRLRKNIVRLATLLVIPYALVGIWALPFGAKRVVFFGSLIAFLVGIPLLIRKNKKRLLLLLLIPVLIFTIDLYPELILGPTYVFLIITVPIGAPLLIGMIVVYLYRRSQLRAGDS